MKQGIRCGRRFVAEAGDLSPMFPEKESLESTLKTVLMVIYMKDGLISYACS